mmetsp:Transcript_55397/g.171905  ORF Transcript_55397/g.171905 Transcript_55397/m.171905 type:complete len:389 (-) Transcript_55397:115-1281(-)
MGSTAGRLTKSSASKRREPRSAARSGAVASAPARPSGASSAASSRWKLPETFRRKARSRAEALLPEADQGLPGASRTGGLSRSSMETLDQDSVGVCTRTTAGHSVLESCWNWLLKAAQSAQVSWKLPGPSSAWTSLKSASLPARATASPSSRSRMTSGSGRSRCTWLVSGVISCSSSALWDVSQAESLLTLASMPASCRLRLVPPLPWAQTTWGQGLLAASAAAQSSPSASPKTSSPCSRRATLPKASASGDSGTRPQPRARGPGCSSSLRMAAVSRRTSPPRAALWRVRKAVTWPAATTPVYSWTRLPAWYKTMIKGKYLGRPNLNELCPDSCHPATSSGACCCDRNVSSVTSHAPSMPMEPLSAASSLAMPSRCGCNSLKDWDRGS